MCVCVCVCVCGGGRWRDGQRHSRHLGQRVRRACGGTELGDSRQGKKAGAAGAWGWERMVRGGGVGGLDLSGPGSRRNLVEASQSFDF